MASLAQPLMQIGLAAWQAKQAKKLNRDLVRPAMEVPQAMEEAVGLSRSLAGTSRMAGQDDLEASLDAQAANTASNVFDTATSSTEALGALTNLNAGRSGMQQEISQQALQNYMLRNVDLSKNLMGLADMQNEVFRYNEVLPFEERRAAVEAFRGAAMDNAFAGATGFTNTLDQAGKDAASILMGMPPTSGGNKSTTGGGSGAIIPSTLSPTKSNSSMTETEMDAMIKSIMARMDQNKPR
jgi:hypothetical protein